jgi:hypothetical protein
MRKDLTSRRIVAARVIAIAADALQIGLLPLFSAGALAPFNDVLDVAIAVVMIRLLGWHPAFLPTLVAELIPLVDVFPTWTIAVLFATRRGQRSFAEPVDE